MTKTLRFINLFAMGIETGTAVFVLRAVLPVIQRWPDKRSSEVRREILVHGAYNYILVTHVVARVAGALVLVVDRRADRLSRAFTAIGLAAGIGVFILTQFRLFPVNRAIVKTPAGTVPEDYARLGKQWDQSHTLRVVLDLFAFACFLAGTLLSREDRRR